MQVHMRSSSGLLVVQNTNNNNKWFLTKCDGIYGSYGWSKVLNCIKESIIQGLQNQMQRKKPSLSPNGKC